MANPYTDPTIFKNWLPQRYLAELTDDIGGQEPDNDKLQKALDWGANIMESKLMVRDDIPIPVVSADNSTNETIRECVHDLALYRLFNRRGTMQDEVREQFDVQMTWLNDIVRRRANIKVIGASGENVTATRDIPIAESGRENQFKDFTF